MKIIVYDVAAEDGGGLFVLKNFYDDIINKSPSNIEWIVMTSLDILEETSNVKIMRYKKVKKSWLHRLWFENVELPRIISNINPGLLISLQNMPVMRCECRQFVYLHQSLQYCPKRFSVLEKAERSLAIRQKIICRLIKVTIQKADHIFVQTKWIKEATCRWLKCPSDKVTVVPVTIEASSLPIKPYIGQKSNLFFYPARAEMYKNHYVIIEACKILVKEGIKDFKILFTINEQDGAYAKQICKDAEGLPIEFIGMVPYEKIWEYYSKSILLFSSYLETCGLPLMEARIAKARILTSDMPFSHEVLEGYSNAEFFTYDDSYQLAKKMKTFLLDEKYYPIEGRKIVEGKSLLLSMLEKI